MRESRLKLINERNQKARSFLIAFYFLYTYIEPYFINTLGSIGKYLTFVILVGLIFFSRRFFFKSYHIALIGWLIYKFFSLLWTTDYTIFDMHYLTHLGTIALLVLVTAVEDSKDCYETTLKSIWAGSAILGVLSIFLSKTFEHYESRQVLTLFNFQNDPNNQAAFLTFGFAISLNYLLYEKKNRWLHIAVILINGYTALLTGSRGGLLSIIAIVFVYVITLYDKSTLKANYKRIFAIAFICLAAGVIIINLLPAEVSDRLFDFETYEGGSDRDIIWRHGLSILSNPINLIIGAGWGAYKTNGFSSLHNTFMSILCDGGLIGFSLLFAPTIKSIIAMMKKRNILPFSVFVAGMAPSFFFEAINKRSFWNAIIFVFIAYNFFLNEQKDQKENK